MKVKPPKLRLTPEGQGFISCLFVYFTSLQYSNMHDTGLEMYIFGAVCLCLLVGYVHLRAGGACRLPPGPNRLPIIGSVHHMPRELAWLKAAEWRSQYGE